MHLVCRWKPNRGCPANQATSRLLRFLFLSYPRHIPAIPVISPSHSCHIPALKIPVISPLTHDPCPLILILVNALLIFTFTMMIYPSWYSSPDFTSVKFTLKINIVLLPDPDPHPEQAPDSLHISSRLWSLLLRLVRRVSNFSGNSRTTVGRTLSLTRCTGTTPTLLRYHHHHDEARISLRGDQIYFPNSLVLKA